MYKPTPYMVAQLRDYQLATIAGYDRDTQWILCQVMEQDRLRKNPHLVKAADVATKKSAKAATTAKAPRARASWAT